MKFTDFLKVFILGLALSVMSGCEKAPEQTPEQLADLTISLGLDKVDLGSAQIRVRHDGPNNVYWVYMVTPDLESDASQLLTEKLAKDLEIYDEIIVYSGCNKSLRVDDLDPKTEYRFICAALDRATGLVYGDVAEYVFRTRRDPSIFNLNDNWSIAVGQRYINQADKMEYDVFKCSSTDENSYLMFALKSYDFKSLYNSDVRKLFEDYVADMGIPEGDRQWKEVLIKGSKDISEYRLRSGEWCAFMVGVDEDGELSGYYQRLDFTVEPEEMSADYIKWLGSWTVCDRDGNERFKVDVIQNEPNMWYYLAGWEADNAYRYDTYSSELMIEVFFDKATGTMVFVNQYVSTRVDDSDKADFYFSGSFRFYGSDYVVPREYVNQRLAEALIVNADGSEATISGLTFPYNGTEFQINEICYAYYREGSTEPGTISLEIPNLPLKMKRE